MKESDIRPQHILDQYLELSRIDGQKLDKNLFVKVDCPACASTKHAPKIQKYNFNYDQCVDCGSVFCNPRPTPEQLDFLYAKSESSEFWSKVFFPTVKDARREKIFRPRAKGMTDIIKGKNRSMQTICEVGAGHGLLLEEVKALYPQASYFAVEPDSHSASECEKKGIKTLVTISEKAQEWHGKFDVVFSSETIEHVQSVHDFVKSIFDLTNENGSCVVTGLGYEGFDILTLQEKSKSVSPPHHLNFLSVKGFEELFKKVGFKHVEVTTPGKLDVDIAINAGTDSEFLRVLKNRGEQAIQEFQNLLAKHKMSSHIWIYAER